MSLQLVIDIFVMIKVLGLSPMKDDGLNRI